MNLRECLNPKTESGGDGAPRTSGATIAVIRPVMRKSFRPLYGRAHRDAMGLPAARVGTLDFG